MLFARRCDRLTTWRMVHYFRPSGYDDWNSNFLDQLLFFLVDTILIPLLRCCVDSRLCSLVICVSVLCAFSNDLCSNVITVYDYLSYYINTDGECHERTFFKNKTQGLQSTSGARDIFCQFWVLFNV